MLIPIGRVNIVKYHEITGFLPIYRSYQIRMTWPWYFDFNISLRSVPRKETLRLNCPILV